VPDGGDRDKETPVPSQSRITHPPAAADPKVVALYEYWRRIAPAVGVLPGRQHVDPLDIPSLLANVWLIDVVADPRRFRVRLVGTALEKAGMPLRRGDFMLDRVPPEARERARAELDFVADTRQPLWFRGRAYLPHEKYVHEIERLFLPLAADGVTVDMFLCLGLIHRAPGEMAAGR